MTEQNNVSQFQSGTTPPGRADKPEKPAFDPRYSVREPSIEDAVNLVGALARGVTPETMRALASDNAEHGVYDLFLNAIADPLSRNEVMLVLADLWLLEVNADEPHEDWDYDPDPKNVERGQELSRPEMWRTIKRSNRKRLIKRIELGKLPVAAFKDFYHSFAASTGDLQGFFGQVGELVRVRSGGSTTDSPNGTDGINGK